MVNIVQRQQNLCSEVHGLKDGSSTEDSDFVFEGDVARITVEVSQVVVEDSA
jgi:hypothetical protein